MHCGTVQCGAVRYGKVRCGAAQYGTVRCNVVQCSKVRYGAVQCVCCVVVWCGVVYCDRSDENGPKKNCRR